MYLNNLNRILQLVRGSGNSSNLTPGLTGTFLRLGGRSLSTTNTVQTPSIEESGKSENQISYQISAVLEVHKKIDKAKNESYVEAIPTKTGREGKVINVKDASKSCVLCRLNLRNLNYTDVMILSQFLEKDGNLLTYHETQLCTKQYHKVSRLIKQAQRCNLMPRPKDYLVPGPWHDLNTYIEPDRQRDQPMKVIKKQYWKI